MNGLDIISIVILILFVVIGAFKGLLKIVSGWGALFAAIFLSKLFGGLLGEKLLGDSFGAFAPVVGTVVCFIILYILLRIIFGSLAKLIKKALQANTLDHILGAVAGAVIGLAVIFVLALLLEVFFAVASVFNPNADVVKSLSELAEESFILKYFVRLVKDRGMSLF